jgi:hypothetical protein
MEAGERMKKRARSGRSSGGSAGAGALERLEALMEKTAVQMESLRRHHAGRLLRLGRERVRLQERLDERVGPAGGRVWGWVEGIHRDGRAERVRRLLGKLGKFSDSIEILGPLGEDGKPHRGGTGACWVSLRLDRPSLRVSRRTGPAWGDAIDIETANDFGKVPAGIVGRLAQASDSDAAWDTILAALAAALTEHGRHERAGVVGGVNAVAAELRGLRRALATLGGGPGAPK